MATVSKFYKDHIAEGKGILTFSIILAIVTRILFYLFSNTDWGVSSYNGYLWIPLASFFENSLFSILGSSIMIAMIATMAGKINTEFVLIRRRTLLPSAIIILLFSCHPLFLKMSPAHVSIVFIFFILSELFASYNSTEKSIATFKIFFLLSLGSLFTPILLFYTPILWIALIIIRCFNFKSIFASLFGILIIYFPVFSYYLFTNDLATFYEPFLLNKIEYLTQLPILFFNIPKWSVLVLSLVMLSIVFINNYVNSHKDKIKIRAYISVLSFITLAALILSLALNISFEVNLFITVGFGSILISHFFALIEKKSGVSLFYISSVVYFLICILSFSSVL